MKQTNNAIKFLMAQYRAIFKNANIAMVAAMAAAALAAGQAQAAPDAITDWDKITSGTIDANTTNGKALAIVADADKTESNGFDLTITSGSHTIKGKSGQNALTTAKNKTTTITLNGAGTDATQPTLKIGSDQANEHVAVTITNLNNYAGTVTIEGNGAASSLTAKNIQIGGSAPASDGGTAKAAAASKAVVSLGASGEIIAAKGGTFNILNGGELKFAGAASKAQAESGITLNGGKISVADSATGTVDGALTVTSGGAVEVNGGAADTTLTVSGLATINDGTFDIVKGGSAASGGKAILSKGITMNGGILTVQGDTTDVKSGKLEVTGAATFNTGSKLAVQKSGTATFNGNLTLADGTIENAGTVALNMAEGATSTLTVGADSLAELLKGKVSGSGATSSSGKTETLKLVIDSDVDLVKAGLVDEANGNAKANFAIDSSVENTSLTAKNVTIGAGTYAATKSLTVDSLTAGKEGAFTVGKDLTATVKNGLTVTAKGEKADLTVNGILNLEGAGSVIGANKIELAQDASSSPALNVNKGTWGVKDLTLTSGAATVTGEGTKLNVNGMLTTTTNGSLAIKNNAVVDASSGDLTLVAEKVDLTGGSTLILDSADVFKIDGSNVTLVTPKGEVKSKFEQGAVKTDGTSILQLNYSGNLAVADLDKIKNAIDKNTGLKGFIRLEGANITGKPTEDVTLNEAKEGFDGLYDNVAIKVDTSAGTVNKSLTAAQIKLTDASATGAAIADNKKVLLKGDGQNGNFVMKSNSKVADVSLGSGSALVLAGSGKVGDIKATAATNTGKASLSIGHSAATGTVDVTSIDGATAGLDVSVFNSTLNVAGKVAAKDLTLDGSALKITAEAGSGSVSADTLSVGSGSSILAKGQDITIAGTSASKILGDVTAKSLSLGAKGAEIAGDAVINLDKLDLGNGLVQVGNDAAEKNGSATVVVQNLTGEGTLFVDPKYTEKAALVIANNLSGSSTPDNEQDAGTLQGSAIVGNNAALGIGFASEAELKAVLGQFLEADDGSFTEDPAADKLELANALVLNEKITIAGTKGITVKKGATKNDIPASNTVTLEAGTGLIVTDNVYKVLDDGSKSGAAITFGASGTVSSSGGKVILSGNFDGEDNALEIFSNVQTVSGTLTVQSANGLLKGEINNNNKGKVNLDVNEDALKGAFTGVSAPVAELLKNTLRGEYKGAKGLGADFVYSVAGTSLTGAEVDAAAHAATYAGAQQAAVAAVTTMADAMFGRVGAVGVEAASISATGSQANGGVWLTPMYKSVDSDGFNAEGVSYGSDVDLAGVAFGTDTVNGNMRFGAVFNIGSGDAEGKGQGNGLKDEFDYYGFGIYSAMGFGNFALVGDASMTVISHDVEGFGLKGKADTTAVTMGVTGQYTVSTPMVDVTPHLGARFIRLNTDSYDLTSADGVLATTDFDVQNVFSVPVGVTLSKAFAAGGWSLAPSADLTIAFNTGDTDAKSNTQFNSSKSMSVATNTEVLDEVTYGLTLGLGAQYGAFGTSFGINYTGSSNTDSLGVNAQARYMF